MTGVTAIGPIEEAAAAEPRGLRARVRGAVLWRSGSQILAQLVMWAGTFFVIRTLDPADYGLFAMSQVILVFLTLMNGHGFAGALVRQPEVSEREVRQVFGMLLLLNGGLALCQVALAPVAAAYYRQPIVADMLRVQALLYLATPFIALPQALLSRRIDFRRQGQVQLLSAFASAGTAVACALSGWGVWTLVAAPLVLFWTQAVGLTFLARSLVRPSFRFAGAAPLLRYGGAMVAVQFFWFVQSQSDVFIAGRRFEPHALGLYTTSLFLTQILAAKFVPPINEVSFAAYSRLQERPQAVAAAFVKVARLVLLVALPFYCGMAATAEPLVLTVLGEKWRDTIPLVRILAFAMPFMTLQILFAPATNALGRPRIALFAAMAGAALMPLSFLVAVHWGTAGLARAWLLAFPLLLAVTMRLSLPVIGLRLAELAGALAPPLAAAAGMGMAVAGLDALLPPVPAGLRLAALVAFGTAAYAGLLFAFARPLLAELLALLRPGRPAAQAL
jgi:O-antigen/teichoic acid export membrane protein